VGAEIGVLLLLFMLGLEYSGEELKANLHAVLPAGAVDLVLNFTPGLVTGLLSGWKPLPSVLLGGVTYISSSGVIHDGKSGPRFSQGPSRTIEG
jgi:CPA2 family monovalent cation:H+ antiporter-2